MSSNDPGIITTTVAQQLEALTGIRAIDFSPRDISVVFHDLPCWQVDVTHDKPAVYRGESGSISQALDYLFVQGFYQLAPSDTTGRDASREINRMAHEAEAIFVRNFSLWGTVDGSALVGKRVEEVALEAERTGIVARWCWLLIELSYAR